MKATKAKLESYKRPRPATVMRGRVSRQDDAPKQGASPKLNTSMLRMALAGKRRAEGRYASEVMADSMATRRQGTMDRDTEMLELIDQHMQGVDELLNELSQ